MPLYIIIFELWRECKLPLNAENNIALTSAQNTQTVDGKNSSKGNLVGEVSPFRFVWW